MVDLVKIYKKLENKPMGKWLFTKVVCRTAPYFSSISPSVEELSFEHCIVSMPKKRSVYNHIKTVHAIAACNLAEMAAGLLMVASTPKKGLRWLPKGMNVQYLKKCDTALRAEARIKLDDLKVGDNIIHVPIKNTRDEVVVVADINMYLTEDPKLKKS